MKLGLDLLLASILIAGGTIAGALASRSIGPGLFDPALEGSWFGASSAAAYRELTAPGPAKDPLETPPLLALVGSTTLHCLKAATGETTTAAARATLAIFAGLWGGAQFLLLRAAGTRRPDAVIFTLVAMASAGAMFWLPVPSPLGPGSLGLTAVLGLALLVGHRRVPAALFVLAGTLALGFSVIAGAASIAAIAAVHPPRRSIQLAGNILCATVLIWGLRVAILDGPTAGAAAGASSPTQQEDPADSPPSGCAGAGMSRGGSPERDPVEVLRSLAVHSLVMPAAQEMEGPESSGAPILTVKVSGVGSGGSLAIAGTLLWLSLLALGIRGAVTAGSGGQWPRQRLAIPMVLAVLATSGLLHGGETFRASVLAVPPLVTLASLGTVTRARVVALGLGSLLLCCLAVHNATALGKANTVLEGYGPQRAVVRRAMSRRPGDPWPRSDGHVILALPGTTETRKGYHEPGGSFSPGPGSFGIAIWVTDERGEALESSDTLPLDQFRQRLKWTAGQALPGILTSARDYEATWSCGQEGTWNLRLRATCGEGRRLSLAVRSVGPAGGPIRSLHWDQDRLVVNGRWHVSVEPHPASVHLGEEGAPGWTSRRTASTSWSGWGGWGVAVLELRGSGEWGISVEDGGSPVRGVRDDERDGVKGAVMQRGATESPEAPPLPGIAGLPFHEGRSTIEVDLPDERFKDCLDAQVAHLLMSLVGRQTRSSDPFNVPVAWARTGAYITVALAAAGQLDVARELSVTLAERDLYGGFGPEADGPGLAIWALEEVAARIHDPVHDREIWPHVRRKAELIVRLVTTREPVRAAVEVPAVPRYRDHPDLDLVSEPTRAGLIMGRMDFHRPVLYITAVSYRGLVDAARLADRLGEQERAASWRTAARGLRDAWERAFHGPQSANPRTLATALWPTSVGARHAAEFRRALDRHWARSREGTGVPRDWPLWSYFEVAEAHQWLLLGEPGRALAALRWFWDHQASPGLYTWWEDVGEGNAYGGWNGVRGWVRPPNSQPHYWTTAEMLLLQVECLVYLVERGDADVPDGTQEATDLVIGAGVPQEWMDRPISVRGIRTRAGRVDWSWDGCSLHVTLRGERCRVRAGLGFGAGVSPRVEHLPWD